MAGDKLSACCLLFVFRLICRCPRRRVGATLHDVLFTNCSVKPFVHPGAQFPRCQGTLNDMGVTLPEMQFYLFANRNEILLYASRKTPLAIIPATYRRLWSILRSVRFSKWYSRLCMHPRNSVQKSYRPYFN